MTTLTEAMAEVAADLVELALPATSDPRVAAQWNGGAVILVTPPTRDYRLKLTTWTLAVLVPTTSPTLETTKKIGTVLEQMEAVLPLLEEAKPGRVLVVPDRPPYPCYLVTMTTV